MPVGWVPNPRVTVSWKAPAVAADGALDQDSGLRPGVYRFGATSSGGAAHPFERAIRSSTMLEAQSARLPRTAAVQNHAFHACRIRRVERRGESP